MLGKLFDKILHEEENDNVPSSVESDSTMARQDPALDDNRKEKRNQKQPEKGFNSAIVTPGVEKDAIQVKKEAKTEKDSSTRTKIKSKAKGWDWIIAMGILALAIGVRVYYLFNISDPQNAGDAWYDDTYHHWQVAYLTREIGLGEGFLRLWDLKGMEYFWGPIHPVLMIVMFKLTGTVSIVNARMLSLIFGSLVIVALYLIISKLWNRSAGLAAALLAVIHPVAILNDTSGMLEPIGLFLLLLGILMLNSVPLLTGVLWAMAAMARAEAWMFGGLLLLLSIKAVRKSGKLPALFVGYVLTILAYLKYLLDHTGNPIYPIWWNYLANARGAWSDETTIDAYQAMVKPYLVAWFVISFVLLGLVLWKAKGRKKLFLGLGLANWTFIGGFMGLSHYLKGFEPWFWYIRFFEFPYVFAGILVSLGLFYWVGKKVKVLGKMPGQLILWLPIVIIAIACQLIFWPPIMARYDKTKPIWRRTKSWAGLVIKEYQGGTISFPGGYPGIFYWLVYNHGVEGKNVQAQMWDPFFYMEGDPFSNWGENRPVVLNWLKEDDIRYIITESREERYGKLVKQEPELFEQVSGAGPFVVYRVLVEKI
jgi:hypothetical protein